ncbi:EF-hand domain-containing protein [Luteolibacter arcticus]|uniref:EF-hand domain-containing protein n=1 Tax=Luteolibacter arcticus TaxID=1581411 RepID=A0ABT3GJU8_9BACT|nr:EF-hand domain-containing protein [Luteolibacter arcticus]MCW1923782.1 EF-hand domain-containing protein [Luteolibacter arcticus]
MKLVSGLFCLAAAFSFTGCSSTSPSPTVEQSFKTADMNGDGKVSRQEYDAHLIGEMFARFDGNKDSVITEKEFVDNGGTKEGFYRVNTSGSGKITLQEARASAGVKKTLAAPFKEADANGDGQVTLEEFRSSREKALDYVR